MIEVEQDMTEGRAWTRTELDAYLNDRYVTFDGLADGTGLDGETLERLIETGCMPGPSYELRHRDELYAYINGDVNTISIRTIERYFAKDVIAWAKLIEPRLRDTPPEDLALVLKSELRATFREGLAAHGAAQIGYEGFVAPDGKIDDDGFSAHFEDYIWPNWREGTWGICVYGSEHMQNVARKTVAVNRLKLLTEDGAKDEYSSDQARNVHAAMVEYDAIVPPFSPHDRHDSSRARLVEALSGKVGYDPR